MISKCIPHLIMGLITYTCWDLNKGVPGCSLRWRHNGDDSSQITSLTSVYSTVYSGADQSKHQSSASLAFVWGIHRWIPRTNGQLRGKCFHLMTSSCTKRNFFRSLFSDLLLLFWCFFHNLFIDKAAFNSCQYSSVAVIPIPYECDLQNLTAAFNAIPGGEYNGWGFITASSYISDIAVPGILPW